ncbi:MAG: hypothetical protein IJ354_07995 [Clostridia bacterium]|nr:hypothetical protein [Clostridia bacterium]
MNKRFSFRIHPAGWIVLLFAWLIAPSLDVLAGMFALIWHESAHALAMLACGLQHCSIELTPFGGMADAADYNRLSPGKQAVCASAGIVASLLGMVSCAEIHHPFFLTLSKYHFSLLAVNVLPVWPLDGSRVLLAIARKTGVEYMCHKAMAFFAWMIGAGFLVLGLYGLWLGVTNISLLLCGPYLCYASREGGISEKIRKIEHMTRKLSLMDTLPVKSYACLKQNVETTALQIFSKNESGKYHVLFAVDESDGEVQNIYTETQLLQKMLKR